MSSINDKLTDTRNSARPNSAAVSSNRASGVTTLSCDNLAGWPTASAVHFVTYQIDTNNDPVDGTQCDWKGIVSGNTIGSLTLKDGTDNGNTVGDVVEMLPTAAWGQDLADALTVGHTRTGLHASALPLTSPVLTTPVITDYTSAGHTHASAAQGGQLTGSTALVNTTVTADKLNTGAQVTTTATSETTASTSYADLATVGPSATATIGANGLALVIITCRASNDTAAAYSIIGCVISGANTVAAADTKALIYRNSSGAPDNQASYCLLYTGLTAGSTTFKLQYRVSAGTGTFQNRSINVIPL